MPIQIQDQPPHQTGCLVCGGALEYRAEAQDVRCAFCGLELRARESCVAGHYVCDSCHAADGLQVIHRICATTRETDLIALLRTIRSHPTIPVHGPEHHGMVPGILLACYRNLGGTINGEPITDRQIHDAILRGAQVVGGHCGYMGVCGAATGAGVGFGALLGAHPLDPVGRQRVMTIAHQVLGELTRFEAARCCQRDVTVGLLKVAELSRDLLPIPLRAEADPTCTQYKQNHECLRRECPFFPARKRGTKDP